MKAQFTRRDFLKTTTFYTISLFPFFQTQKIIKEFFVYIGTYTSGKSEGIYIGKMDLSSGELKLLKSVKGLTNPSYLAIDPHNQYLYSVNEVGKFEGKPGGAISAFSINQKTGDLTFLNNQPTKGSAPCYIVVDKSGKFVLSANYGDGNVSVFSIMSDGKLGPMTDFIQHKGSGLDPKRQKSPHAHCIVMSPDNRFTFSADLGIDKIMVYKFDAQKGKLTPNDTPFAQLAPGAGPRHFTFHPNEKYAYVINELNSTLIAFAYDETNGILKEIQTVSTLPEGFKDNNYPADVHVSSSGDFIYGSNRGHDSIVIFSIDKNTGKLSLVGHESTQGKWPRNFAIDPTGRFLLAENQNSDTVVPFQIDNQTGKLIPTGNITNVPAPVCIQMIPV